MNISLTKKDLELLQEALRLLSRSIEQQNQNDDVDKIQRCRAIEDQLSNSTFSSGVLTLKKN